MSDSNLEGVSPVDSKQEENAQMETAEGSVTGLLRSHFDQIRGNAIFLFSDMTALRNTGHFLPFQITRMGQITIVGMLLCYVGMSIEMIVEGKAEAAGLYLSRIPTFLFILYCSLVILTPVIREAQNTLKESAEKQD